MSMRQKIINQIIQNLEDLQFTPNWSNAQSQKFEYLIDEWLCHKNNESFKKSKSIATSCWDKNTGWKEFLRQTVSQNLFAYGESDRWFDFIHSVADEQKDPLDVCDEMIDWVIDVSAPLIDSLKVRAKVSQPCKSYEREVIAVLPYSQGVLTVACFRFPHNYLTLPHYHPEIVVERILQGTLSEVVFNKSIDDKYTFSKIERYTPDKKLMAHKACGHPHMVTGDESDVVSVAIFAGSNPIRLLSPDSIDNPVQLRAAIESLTQADKRHHLEKFFAV